jgi:hypothetical protein
MLEPKIPNPSRELERAKPNLSTSRPPRSGPANSPTLHRLIYRAIVYISKLLYLQQYR